MPPFFDYLCGMEQDDFYGGGQADFIFGRHPVVEALENGSPVDKVLLLVGTKGELEITLRKLCRERDVPLSMVPKEKLQRITQSNHQGVIAWMAAAPYYKIEDVLPMIYDHGDVPLLMIVDGVTDVRNFGAIARSAVGFGAHTMIVGHKNQAPLSSEAMKASAGGLLKMPICRSSSLVLTADFLIESGIQLIATDLDAEMELKDCDFTKPTAFILGAEDSGVSEGVLRKCTHRVMIPQTGEIDSLNVSVAAGICLYEAIRQRGL
jgi:23S rRNA (guanosine2251-2'-O)-methyltransferase